MLHSPVFWILTGSGYYVVSFICVGVEGFEITKLSHFIKGLLLLFNCLSLADLLLSLVKCELCIEL